MPPPIARSWRCRQRHLLAARSDGDRHHVLVEVGAIADAVIASLCNEIDAIIVCLGFLNARPTQDAPAAAWAAPYQLDYLRRLRCTNCLTATFHSTLPVAVSP